MKKLNLKDYTIVYLNEHNEKVQRYVFAEDEDDAAALFHLSFYSNGSNLIDVFETSVGPKNKST